MTSISINSILIWIIIVLIFGLSLITFILPLYGIPCADTIDYCYVESDGEYALYTYYCSDGITCQNRTHGCTIFCIINNCNYINVTQCHRVTGTTDSFCEDPTSGCINPTLPFPYNFYTAVGIIVIPIFLIFYQMRNCRRNHIPIEDEL